MIETGILFDDIHSFHDLNLVLAPFTYTPAQPKENFIDIPGGDGSVDLTEAQGEVKFEDREFTFKFTVFPEDEKTFEERQSIVANALNGKRFKITLDKDPDYYWEGRCKVNDYLCNKKLRQITIVAKVKPYKMMQHETVLSFDLTTSRETIYLPNKRKSVVPIITCTNDDTTVYFEGFIATLPAGDSKVLDFQLKEGSNEFEISGTGTITFTYREGEL